MADVESGMPDLDCCASLLGVENGSSSAGLTIKPCQGFPGMNSSMPSASPAGVLGDSEACPEEVDSLAELSELKLLGQAGIDDVVQVSYGWRLECES